MSNFLDSTNKFIFMVKDTVDKTRNLPTETIDYLLGQYLKDDEEIKNLQEQLIYAMKNGEYLEVIKVLH
jgi:hypothetical protein